SADAVAQGDGPPRGREIEIADLLAFIKHAGIRNTVWLTADMHYTAAHYYDPNAAVFQTSSRSGNSFPVRSMQAPGGRNRSTTLLAHARCSKKDAAANKAMILRRASGCNSSGRWRSTAQAR